jgi:hypothetical protein
LKKHSNGRRLKMRKLEKEISLSSVLLLVETYLRNLKYISEDEDVTNARFGKLNGDGTLTFEADLVRDKEGRTVIL